MDSICPGVLRPSNREKPATFLLQLLQKPSLNEQWKLRNRNDRFPLPPGFSSPQKKGISLYYHSSRSYGWLTTMKIHSLSRPVLVPLFCICSVLFLQAQDTAKVMVYNLLQYPNASNYTTKNTYLDTIVSHVRPTILGVNELNPPATNADNLLNLVLKPRLGATYTRAAWSATSGSPVANMLFYDSAYFRMKAQYSIAAPVREANAYVLYYNDPTLAQSQDTTFLTVIVTHLKAGNTPADSSDRLAMSQAITNWLSTRPVPGNYIVMGDFNVQSSQEGSFQELLNASPAGVRMIDPVNQLGNWNNNSAFANWFTQSTRTTAESDGGSNGGMDDRLDHLLINESLRDNLQRIQYVPNSFTVVGQDGIRYNQSITNPANTAVSPTVALALYGMSDHLPVTARFALTPSLVSTEAEVSGTFRYRIYPNPAYGWLAIQPLSSPDAPMQTIEVLDLSGRICLSETVSDQAVKTAETRISLSGLVPGMYIIRIQDTRGSVVMRRFLKF